VGVRATISCAAGAASMRVTGASPRRAITGSGRCGLPRAFDAAAVSQDGAVDGSNLDLTHERERLARLVLDEFDIFVLQNFSTAAGPTSSATSAQRSDSESSLGESVGSASGSAPRSEWEDDGKSTDFPAGASAEDASGSTASVPLSTARAVSRCKRARARRAAARFTGINAASSSRTSRASRRASRAGPHATTPRSRS